MAPYHRFARMLLEFEITRCGDLTITRHVGAATEPDPGIAARRKAAGFVRYFKGQSCAQPPSPAPDIRPMSRRTVGDANPPECAASA